MRRRIPSNPFSRVAHGTILRNAAPARLVEATRKKIAKALDLRTIGYTCRQVATAMRISLTRADDLVVQRISEIIREPARARGRSGADAAALPGRARTIRYPS
jgi:hypothetical protein